MRNLLAGLALSTALATAPGPGALAAEIGVSMAADDKFLSVLRHAMQEYASTLPDVTLDIEDARNDVGEQMHQIQTFIAAGVDAIIVNPVDTDATVTMTLAAEDARIPLVYVNRQPVNANDLPDSQAYVGSDERESGTIETEEACRLLKAAGKDRNGGARILVLVGDLSNQAARQRTEDIRDVIATPECNFMKIVEEQAGNWSRTQGAHLMANWLAGGTRFDAVISNNDEMALGAIQAMKSAGLNMNEVVVSGIDATQDALAAIEAGDLDATVFQNAAGQAKAAIDTALALARGEKVDRQIVIPFELVTRANVADYLTRN